VKAFSNVASNIETDMHNNIIDTAVTFTAVSLTP
jgi:hypothetical protein